ncbi:glycoside hydrolase family 12 protein [Suillus cothurnatus]|nr:glycoside hydrolase family 12 protein [Suillus cothurnatus]
MFFLSFLLLLVPLLSSASRHSTSRMHKVHARSLDTSTITGKWDSIDVGQYSLLNNLWNEQSAAWGYQTSQLTSLNGSTIAWTTTYTWNGGYEVKSFANIQLNTGINQQLSELYSIPTVWQWSMSTNGAVSADVAYDMFTSYTPGGSSVNEIMIWLTNINSGPISKSYDAEGNAVPSVTDIDLEGYTWNLYSGFNGVNQVYSFLPTSTSAIESFNGDVYPFISYLIDDNSLDSSQYLTTVQAGTEILYGSGTFTTSTYSAAIN